MILSLSRMAVSLSKLSLSKLYFFPLYFCLLFLSSHCLFVGKEEKKRIKNGVSHSTFKIAQPSLKRCRFEGGNLVISRKTRMANEIQVRAVQSFCEERGLGMPRGTHQLARREPIRHYHMSWHCNSGLGWTSSLGRVEHSRCHVA